MAYRMHSHGYDFYAPPEAVLYHLWSRAHRPGTCLSMCLYVYISVYMYMCLSAYICMSVCLSIRPNYNKCVLISPTPLSPPPLCPPSPLISVPGGDTGPGEPKLDEKEVSAEGEGPAGGTHRGVG